jgi:hypothetical protein
MEINWFWLVVGFIPYSIKRQHAKNVQMLSLNALFWRLTIRWRRGTCSWDLSIPLITHLKR